MRFTSIAVIFIIFISLYSSGCVGSDPAEAVNTTVNGLLNAIDAGDFEGALTFYSGDDLPVAGSIEFIFEKNGFEKDSIKSIEVTDQQITENMASVDVMCTVIEYSMMGKAVDESQKPVYFRLQDSDIGWTVTKISFASTIVLSEDDLVEIELEETIIDPLAENAPIIFFVAILMFASGIYLDKKEKGKAGKTGKTIDLTGAIPIQKESIAQYLKFVPSQQPSVGNKVTIDIWVKNFTQQPYENLAVTGTFPNTLEVKNMNLFFGTIAPGETVKQTWVVKPKVQGWISITEPTAVFEYGGAKYMGVLDPVWIQVQ
ncbi:MAG TPA: hypothetical protein C5S51_03490 [Methanosarcinaceae archaeon]|nr:hypothetical protein [Methanosarcinaceae archaeon]